MPQPVEHALTGVASIQARLLQTSCRRRDPPELQTRNATPLPPSQGLRRDRPTRRCDNRRVGSPFSEPLNEFIRVYSQPVRRSMSCAMSFVQQLGKSDPFAGRFCVLCVPSRLFLPPSGLVPVARSGISKTTPTGDFAVAHGEDVHPFGLEFLLRISSHAF